MIKEKSEIEYLTERGGSLLDGKPVSVKMFGLLNKLNVISPYIFAGVKKDGEEKIQFTVEFTHKDSFMVEEKDRNTFLGKEELFELMKETQKQFDQIGIETELGFATGFCEVHELITYSKVDEEDARKTIILLSKLISS